MGRRKSKKVTIYSIATECGLSAATVSYILNGHAQKLKFSAKTTEKVLAVADRMGYEPNENARSLRLQRSNLIAIVIANASFGYADFMSIALERQLDPKGFLQLVSFNRLEPERDRKIMDIFRRRQVDGIVSFSPLPENKEFYEDLVSKGTPIVFVGDRIPELDSVSTVMWDNRAAAYAGVNYLINKGFRDIAVISIDRHTVISCERFAGACEALHDANLQVPEKWLRDIPVFNEPGDLERIYNTLEDILLKGGERPKALFAISDVLASIALGFFKMKGIRVPEDLAVVGMSKLDEPHILSPRLTTVAEPFDELAIAAVEVLMEHIQNKSGQAIHRIVHSFEMVPRATA